MSHDELLRVVPITGIAPPALPQEGRLSSVHRWNGRSVSASLRYAHEHDGLPGSERAFQACSVWRPDRILLRRMDDARRLFEQLLGLRHYLGLLAEKHSGASACGRLSA